MKNSPVVREYSHDQLSQYELRGSAKGAGFVIVLIFLSMLLAGGLIWLLVNV